MKFEHSDEFYRQEAMAIAREAAEENRSNGHRRLRPLPKNAAAPIGELVPAESCALRFRTAAEFSQHLPAAPPWVVPGFVAPGVVTEIDGKLKASGKTTFVSHMVKAILAGQPFLDHPTRKVGVVWLTEERPTSFVETLKRAGLGDSTDLHLQLWHECKALPWTYIVAETVRFAETVKAGLLIVDTVGQFAGLRGDSENNSGDALAAIAPLQMAAAHDLAVVVVRHERKGGGEVGESGRGSSAFSGAVDIVISLRRAEGQTKSTVRVLQTLSRFTETPETLVVDLTEHGYIALGSKGTVAVLEAERAILDLVSDTPDGALPLKTICEGPPRLKRTVAQEALKTLTDAGLLTVTGTGKKGDAYCYFRAIKDSAGTQTSRSGSILEPPEHEAEACCKGGPLELKCKLCRQSPTYWNREENKGADENLKGARECPQCGKPTWAQHPDGDRRCSSCKFGHMVDSGNGYGKPT